MEATKREKILSHFRNLLAVAHIDGYMHENEKLWLNSVGRRLGIVQTDINEIMKDPENIELYIPKSMSEKLDQLYDLVLMMLIDGQMDDEEFFVCNVFASQFGLSNEIIENLTRKIIAEVETKSKSEIVDETLTEMGYPIEDVNHPAFFEKVMFVSTDHIRYENGINVSGHNLNCKRGIKIEPNINGDSGYTITVYNMDGQHPLWGNNIQMSPKQMKIEKIENSNVFFKGFGKDSMGISFTDYGMTVTMDSNDKIQKAILHMFDRGIDIEYLK